MPNNIILIGFMGVGKGRTARELAALTGGFSIDTDDLIESFAKKKIRKIFAEDGEARFRSLEQEVADWIEHQVSNTIISTGGGFFKVNNISKLGTVFYLHSSVEAIVAAIQNHPNSAKKIKKRPLLQNLDHARQLYASRLPSYRKAAAHEINIEGGDIAAAAKKILNLC